MAVLSPAEVQQKLATLNDWKLEGEEIVRQLEFPTFPAAIQFVNQVADKAEAAGHHPDIDIRYNRVRLALVSHDAGGLTDSDFLLAAVIDQLT
jgi:4a-hydroxytetrahydrobiopterin dehydratase